MAFFSYKAISANGRSFSSTIEADSISEAKRKLVQKNSLIIEIKPQTINKVTNFSKKEELSFFQHLFRLLNAGLPLYEALVILQEKQENFSKKKILMDISEKIKEGTSLSSALKKYPKSFDELYVCMIENGEKSGNLNRVAGEISAHLSQQMRLKQKIISSLTYPALLLSFCFAVTMTLLFYVIPSLSPLLEGRRLHIFTRGVIAASDIVCQNSSFLLTGVIALVAFFFWVFYAKKGKEMMTYLFYRFFFLRKVLLQFASIRFCKSMASLLSSGLTLVDALKQAQKILPHPFLSDIIEKAQQKIIQGKPLSEALEKAPHPFSQMSKMIAISEESGNLATMFQHISTLQQEEAEAFLQRLVSLIQPILLLVLGLIIGTVMLSILLPLCDAGSLLDI